MTTQQRSSKVSRGRSRGISRRKAPVSTGQCAKSRSCHVCAITHGPEASGHGRCAACLSSGCKRQSAIFNCQLLIRKTFAYLTALTFFPLLDCSVPNVIADQHCYIILLFRRPLLD